MTSNELSQKNQELRDEIIKTLIEKRNEVVNIYYTDPDTIEDGYIELQRSYVFQYVDHDINDVIRSINTIEDNGKIDTGLDSYDIHFRDMTNETLIELIGEMEEMIENPKLIDIN